MGHERRQYAGNAVATKLTSGIGASDTTLEIDDATGWPDGSIGLFGVTVDRLGAVEVLIAESRTGTSITLADVADRGIDGTVAAGHQAGVSVEHTSTLRDYDEANELVAQANLWTPWTPFIGGLTGGMTVTVQSDAANHARYQIVGKTCFVKYHSLLIYAGPTPLPAAFNISLPVPAVNEWNIFSCDIQNVVGRATTSSDLGHVTLLKGDVTSFAVGTYQTSFAGFYEIA